MDLRTEPWWPESAVKYVEDFLTPETTVLEIGSGGSTLWLAKRVLTVQSYEHNKEWYDLVNSKLEEEDITNVTYEWQPDYPTSGFAIDDTFDFIIVDGRGRVRCVETVFGILNSGGHFLLDDAQRERYNPAIQLLDNQGWERKVFKEAIPQTTYIWERV